MYKTAEKMYRCVKFCSFNTTSFLDVYSLGFCCCCSALGLTRRLVWQNYSEKTWGNMYDLKRKGIG
jgi:hypothetical protein